MKKYQIKHPFPLQAIMQCAELTKPNVHFFMKKYAIKVIITLETGGSSVFIYKESCD
jgi:hypothetical protein